MGSSSYPEIDQVRMGRYVETYYDYGNRSSTTNIDCREGNNFRIILGGSITINFTQANTFVTGSNKLYSMSVLIQNGGSGQSINCF